MSRGRRLDETLSLLATAAECDAYPISIDSA
jgi:hypothetical protein